MHITYYCRNNKIFATVLVFSVNNNMSFSNPYTLRSTNVTKYIVRGPRDQNIKTCSIRNFSAVFNYIQE